MVADIHGRRSRDIVDKAITALVNLEHRGAQGAEPQHRRRRRHPAAGARRVPARGRRLRACPRTGSYATGIAFLPQSSARRRRGLPRRSRRSSRPRACRCWAGARCRPTTRRWAHWPATPCRPSVRCSSAAPPAWTSSASAYVVRKRAEHELGTKGPGQDGPGRETVYFPSLSGQTFVYKGMLTTPQLKALLPGPAGRPADQRAGHRALAVLHQHVPVVAAGPPVPARSPTTARSTPSPATRTGCGPARR